MKVKLSRGYGFEGPVEEVEIPNNVYAYLKDYDGCEYVIYSKEIICAENGKEINGRINKEE